MMASVFVVITLLACNSRAALLQSSDTRQNWDDLEVITLDLQGNPAKTVYYSHDQLLTLPTVTVKTEHDPNTDTPATYVGVYIGDLYEPFGADASFDVIGANCLDKFKHYYDREYVARHRPILLLKFDGNAPDDWPRVSQPPGRSEPMAHGTVLGPYCIVHESFTPAETVYGYTEEPRFLYAVVSLELTRFSQSIGLSCLRRVEAIPKLLRARKSW